MPHPDLSARSNKAQKLKNCQVQALKSVTATENGGSARICWYFKDWQLAEVGDETSVSTD
ncbi:MAG: hypothetical protein ACLUD0_05810 [Eubacterium ramulus]